MSAGTLPPYWSRRISDSPWIAFAFAGARPHERIIRSISAGGSTAIAAGVDARANRAGVTWFTRSSVHCAESTTATSSVYGSTWSSGIAASGCSRSRIRAIRRAFSARVTTRRRRSPLRHAP